MVFDNEAALKAALVSMCVGAVAEVEEKVHNEFAGNLNQYYGEFIPAEYIRTGALFGSLDRTGVQPTANGAVAEVYFTTPSYQTGAVPLQNGGTGYATWSGAKVLDYALNRGSHGGYVGGTPIWNDSINSLGDIKALLLNAVKARGL